ncbi:hypothetical protein NCR96_08900 [Helicobacter sp. 14348-15]|uniref:hypothetical protein n=1 Tax=Helicobacter TaxID=209 RepID=UPI001F5A4999|nr:MULTISPECIES: hypothetical protein [Helicobacter]MCI2236794.1 hypothetical protein [Helicobacter sp. CaF467b]MCL9821850.1 hypothetical protein [Helicobacter colisuis]
MNANFVKLDSKTIAKICRTLIVLTILAYLVDKILISSPSFSDWNFKNNSIFTDFNIFIIVFVDFFFVFAIIYECFYNLRERIKTKTLRYIYMVIAGLISCMAMLICFLIQDAITLGIIMSLTFVFMFIFMFIDKILCKARGQ